MSPGRMIRLSVYCILIMALGGASAAAAAAPAGEHPLDLCGIVCGGVVPSSVATGSPADFHGQIYLTPGCTGSPSFDWDFGDGSAHSNLQNPAHTYADIGEYTWTFTVTHPNAPYACVSSGVVQACSFTCEATASPTFGLPPLPVDFTASASVAGTCSDPITYLWDFGDGSGLSRDQNIGHIYTGEGVFNWTMTATSGDLSCSRTGQIKVPCSTLTCAASAPSVSMPGQPVAFAGTVTPPECPDLITYDWDFGDGSVHSQELAPSHTYASAHAYNWTFRATSGTAQCETTGTITVAAPPVIALLKKVAPPFKIVVTGSNLQSGIRVFINGGEWSSVTYKNSTKIQLKGGASLKTVVPKGVPTTFRFLNPDGGEATTTWSY